MNNISKNFIDAVISRTKRRGSTADIVRLRYANDCFYSLVESHPERVLYVGVGHGLDALLALNDGHVNNITGVDPFVGEHGNDDIDYQNINRLIEESDNKNKFEVKRMSIQNYLNHSDDKYDLIICNDVLHHIFWTNDYLTKSKYSNDSVELFNSLTNACTEHGMLIISEPERHGLRQMLTNLGILSGCVNYSTKQPRSEWINAAEKGGWELITGTNYVPWVLRSFSILLSGILGRYTTCDKYILTFRLNRT
jgi:SAM-dependent methyltransferase